MLLHTYIKLKVSASKPFIYQVFYNKMTEQSTSGGVCFTEFQNYSINLFQMRSTDSVITSVGSIINLWHTGRNFISRSNETVVQLHKCKHN